MNRLLELVPVIILAVACAFAGAACVWVVVTIASVL